MIRSVAAVGDVRDPRAWSGIPFHFWQAAKAQAFAPEPWPMDLASFRWKRRLWNASRLLRGQKPGGFQYSETFLREAERQAPLALFRSEVITFNQHFPRAATICAAGGQLNHYLDAPFAALVSGRGLDLKLPPPVVARAAALERENYAASERIITMARWAAEAIAQECGVAPAKVFTILPGANLDLPEDWDFAPPAGRAGRERDFVLGFVGKDWQRKGLTYVLEVRDELARRGWRCAVRAAGDAPVPLVHRAGMEFAGFIDKHRQPGQFARFLAGCDLGCLFSRREALGISTLEFLRAGVPVAGFAHEGLADTLPPDAGFRFALSATPQDAADSLENYLRDEAEQARLRDNARRWSPAMTWQRCVREMQELWTTGAVRQPVRPWMGLQPSLSV